jgi:RimJ/RimL family protein N-acetyltransferase
MEVNTLAHDEFSLRLAKEQDCENIFHWRNSPEVRISSLNSHELNYSEHKVWFDNTIQRENVQLLIAEQSKNPLGVIRFDMNANIAEISIYLVPSLIGKGYGKTLLTMAEEWLQQNRPEITIIQATILAENQRSIKTFLNAGFKEHIQVFRKELPND